MSGILILDHPQKELAGFSSLIIAGYETNDWNA